jgi:hypothetical protein
MRFIGVKLCGAPRNCIYVQHHRIAVLERELLTREGSYGHQYFVRQRARGHREDELLNQPRGIPHGTRLEVRRASPLIEYRSQSSFSP